jgi:aldose 1-epimerase
MGFPGDLEIEVTYQLLKNNTFKITYQAITSKKTVINLTNHAFFNLNGEGSGSILNHQIQIFANEYTPVDSTSIPTGKFENVNHTPFDFRKLTAIGKRINDDNKQLKIGNGYDQNFVLVNNGKNKIAAKVIGDQSGIVMDVYTDQPGIQFYTSNFLKGKNTFKNGAKDDFRTAFCLETQHFPDSPNQPNFPSTVLKPGERFSSISYFQFSTTKH